MVLLILPALLACSDGLSPMGPTGTGGAGLSEGAGGAGGATLATTGAGAQASSTGGMPGGLLGAAGSGGRTADPGTGGRTGSVPLGGMGGDSGQPVSADAGAGPVDAAVDGGLDGDVTSTAAQLCVDTINMYRATLGLAPYLRWSPDMEDCASREALSDSQTNTAHGAFGMCTENAQDECPGWGGSLDSVVTGCLAQMWAEGPGADYASHGHYINMSSTKYTRAACGFATTPTGKIWAAQNFK
jgi:hypothetical protein